MTISKIFYYYFIGIITTSIGLALFSITYYFSNNFFFSLFLQFTTIVMIKYFLYKKYLFKDLKFNKYLKIIFFFYIANNLFLYFSNIYFENIYMLQLTFVLISTLLSLFIFTNTKKI